MIYRGVDKGVQRVFRGCSECVQRVSEVVCSKILSKNVLRKNQIGFGDNGFGTVTPGST